MIYCVQVQVRTATLDAQFFKQLLAFGMHAQEGYAHVHTILSTTGGG